MLFGMQADLNFMISISQSLEQQLRVDMHLGIAAAVHSNVQVTSLVTFSQTCPIYGMPHNLRSCIVLIVGLCQQVDMHSLRVYAWDHVALLLLHRPETERNDYTSFPANKPNHV